MTEFKAGDIVYHKATYKRLVIKGPGIKRALLVTTADDEMKSYQPEELWTEEEWNLRNRNMINPVPESPDFSI